MSQYSGKCDLYDHFAIACDGDDSKLQQEIKRTDFYISTPDWRTHKLKIECEKDLAPYYPYLISVGAFNRGEERQYILLSRRSFVDSEEQERLDWALEDALKAYNRCKRKKISFDPEEYIKSYWGQMPDWEKELVYRVAKDGKKATTERLHTPIHDYFRRRLAEELERLGYDDWFIRRWLFDDREKDFNWRKENED